MDRTYVSGTGTLRQTALSRDESGSMLLIHLKIWGHGFWLQAWPVTVHDGVQSVGDGQHGAITKLLPAEILKYNKKDLFVSALYRWHADYEKYVPVVLTDTLITSVMIEPCRFSHIKSNLRNIYLISSSAVASSYSSSWEEQSLPDGSLYQLISLQVNISCGLIQQQLPGVAELTWWFSVPADQSPGQHQLWPHPAAAAWRSRAYLMVLCTSWSVSRSTAAVASSSSSCLEEQSLPDGSLYQLISLQVYSSCGFIKQQQLGGAQQSTAQAQQLSLSNWEVLSPFLHLLITELVS
jgi:hypothetical protein